MKQTYTFKQLQIIAVCRGSGLRTDNKGQLYYFVPSTVRRSGRMLVSKKEIDTLKKAGLI